jgi:hypothetical protein
MFFWIRKVFSDARAHGDAFGEVFTVTLVSLIPLFLLPIGDQLRNGSGNILAGTFLDAISAGQLYLYSFAMLGMILWLCWKEHEYLNQFAPRLYFGLLAFIPSVLIVTVYSFDPTLSKKLSPPLIIFSLVVYALYVCLYYILRVYDNLRPPSVDQQLLSEADAMAARYQEQTPGNKP